MAHLIMAHNMFIIILEVFLRWRNARIVHEEVRVELVDTIIEVVTLLGLLGHLLLNGRRLHEVFGAHEILLLWECLLLWGRKAIELWLHLRLHEEGLAVHLVLAECHDVSCAIHILHLLVQVLLHANGLGKESLSVCRWHIHLVETHHVHLLGVLYGSYHVVVPVRDTNIVLMILKIALHYNDK